jgi:hypothetical protein
MDQLNLKGLRSVLATCDSNGHCIRTCTKNNTRDKRYKERAHLAQVTDFSEEPEQPTALWLEARDAMLESYEHDDVNCDVAMHEFTVTNIIGALYLSQQHLSALLFFTLLMALLIRTFPPKSDAQYAYMMRTNPDYSDCSSSSSSNSKRQKSSNLFQYIRFFVDSGASLHMTKVDRSYFSTFTQHIRGPPGHPDNPIPIGTAGSTTLFSAGHGALGNLAKVLSVPGLSENLFSVKETCRNGYKVLFQQDRCDIFESDDILQLSTPVLSAFLIPPSYSLYELHICKS